jgi:hypothetical protein
VPVYKVVGRELERLPSRVSFFMAPPGLRVVPEAVMEREEPLR